MAVTTIKAPRQAGEQSRNSLSDQPWACHARLWAGLVLFAFVFTHLVNHAIGIFGVGAMEQAQQWRWLLWRSWGGGFLLYGAALVHVVLASYRIMRRSTWRMPRDEAWQIISGLAIPFLVAGHVLQTRVAGSWFDVDQSYHAVLLRLWPAVLFSQTLLLVVSWSHGVIGLHHSLRYKAWYPRWRVAGLVVAVLVPALAFAGFVAGGREAAQGAAAGGPTPEQLAGIEHAGMMMNAGLAGFASAFALLLVGAYVRRRIGSTVTITYRGYGPVRVPRGTSVLEASRMYHIPHPSSCRGRGRCSTCRVQVTGGAADLPDPFAAERALLSGIGAPENVRLACQTRPTRDMSVRILMPVLGQRLADPDQDAQEWAVEREATVIFLDLRAFNTLTSNRLPYEIAVLINRFSTEMTQTVESHGGRIDQMYGDGLLAVFDGSDKPSAGARAALRAARDMTRVLDMLNIEMRGVLPIPIRAGIGIHTGPIILARVGDGVQENRLRAIGVTVTVAAGLEAASKEYLADYFVSEETARASGYDFSGQNQRDVIVDGHSMPVPAYAIANDVALDKVMSGKAMLGVLSAAGM
ncbi:adenylate/guanylate cyclase domain-containing protein [Ancylobacter sp. A5.8]|uniref:adenylate/guanylate cyclase domain-containing protein n=1 Tax=Ancylobacter gelatini TaxID=2919920 RepID=UPI001F4F0FCD|nr:adenylate/guanylate cyclase domain-containing protein [Ancylobacter gelatini]MCJ8142511.1 adenylate/guanylate cyclase domain-containing protein [Ancylobacter gelatini]